MVGDEPILRAAEERIAAISYEFLRPSSEHDYGYVVPRVFKKLSRQQKAASVDINIAIDMLRHTFTDAIDEILLLTGDGDYIPLIREVMRQGKVVYVGAFSSGLNKEIPVIADEFVDLDRFFF